MASLNVSQDEMIDILIGHANVTMPMNASPNPPPNPPPPPPPPPQNQVRSYQESYTELRPANPPPQPMHHQYVCPGCQKSILYTNRNSLVQLLSLHQQKCPGSLRYRYMCLECHNAFKTVAELQDHEGTCRSNGQDSKTVAVNSKPHDRNSIDTGGVIQSLPPGNIPHHETHRGVQNAHHRGTINVQSQDRNSMNADSANVRGQQSYGHLQGGFGGERKFPPHFYNTGVTDTRDQDKNMRNTGGVIQSIPGQPSYGQTPDGQSNDYKMPSSFYRPNTIEDKDPPQNSLNTGGVIQSIPEQQQQQQSCEPTQQEGYNTGKIDNNQMQQESHDVKEEGFIHSMSEKSYEQPQRGGVDNSCKIPIQSQSIDGKDIEENSAQEGGESSGENVANQKVYVRESWTQTYEQPEEEIVEVLLDEISPAGRKRRLCARRMKVYNEKELAEQRENAEIELLRMSSGRKRARILKKELKVIAKEKVPKKQKIKKAVPKKEKDISKVPKKKRERKEKKVKEKEPELAIPMQCQQCPKTFTRYSVYTKHYQLFHERAMCQYCGAQCIRRKLKSHEASHLRTFKCPYPGCTKVLNSNHRLVRHSRIHTGEKPYTCEVCNKPFAGKENMVKHRKRVHEGEKPYQCRYCGRKFADTGRLKYHEGTHTKQRPTDYRCKFCGRGYKSHVGCYLHERTHTGNTVKCQYCGKAFMAKEHLKRHEYIHTGNYPFRCGNCQKGFKDNSSMKKHKCLAVL